MSVFILISHTYAFESGHIVVDTGLKPMVKSLRCDKFRFVIKFWDKTALIIFVQNSSSQDESLYMGAYK